MIRCLDFTLGLQWTRGNLKAGKITVVHMEDIKYQGDSALGWANNGWRGFSTPGERIFYT